MTCATRGECSGLLTQAFVWPDVYSFRPAGYPVAGPRTKTAHTSRYRSQTHPRQVSPSNGDNPLPNIVRQQDNKKKQKKQGPKGFGVGRCLLSSITCPPRRKCQPPDFACAVSSIGGISRGSSGAIPFMEFRHVNDFISEFFIVTFGRVPTSRVPSVQGSEGPKIIIKK